MINQDYVNSMQVWFDGMELSFRRSDHEIKSLEERIALNNRQLDLEKIQLEADKKMYENAKKDFAEYLEANK